MKMKLSEIVIDEKIYPRETVHQDKVDEYVEAKRGGDKFPPLVVHESTKILLDGYHRYLADKELNVEETDVELDSQPTITNLGAERYKLLLRAAYYNARHGIQLTYSEKEVVARKIARADILGEFTQERIAKNLGVAQNTVSGWIKDIKEERDKKRDHLIYRLSRLGWTQEEIGGVIGLSQRQISELVSGFIKFDKNSKDLLSKGYSVEEIGRKLGCDDQALLWSLVLEHESDEIKMVKFGQEPQAFNVWTIQSRDERLGNPHPMNIPGQIVMNLLYYFTEQGDLVVDPMAGGGSTIDACLVMNRKVRAYDLLPVREDILQRDIYDGLDDRAKKAKLIFYDLPYGDMVADKLSHEDFYKLVQVSAEKAYETLGKDGIVAYIMCDYTKGEYEPFIPESYNTFKDIGFKCIHRISVPLSTESANGNEVNLAREKKKLLGRDRVMFIFRKE